MNNFRDIEFLSAYLDGQLSETESKRLESRLASDLKLSALLADLRSTRTILRKLPARRAPRNFRLTRQMVGQKPPLPRPYSLVRFSTALATILLILTFALNAVSQRVSAPAAAPQFGYGGGGGCEQPCGGAPESSAATQAPAAAGEATVAGQEQLNLAPMAEPAETINPKSPTGGEDSYSKTAPNDSASGAQPQAQNEAGVQFFWQIILLVIIILGGLSLAVMRQIAKRKWR